MNFAIPPETLLMFLIIFTMAGFLSSYICYQWQRNKKLDSLIASNRALQETIEKQGIAVNKVLGLTVQSLGHENILE